MAYDDDRLEERSVFTYDVSSDESLSEGVIEAIATATGLDPVPPAGTETERTLDPLYDVIDPEALDSLFGTPGAETGPHGRITFSYHGYEVAVRSEGRIALEPTGPAVGTTAD